MERLSSVSVLLLFCVLAASAQTLPFITEAPICPTPDGRPRGVQSGLNAGTDLERVEIPSPLALCNDGSPAIMYVRRATLGAEDPLLAARGKSVLFQWG